MADNPTSDLLLSAEFTDILSANLLLQPDPDFIFARWAYSALVQQQAQQMDGFNLAMLQLREGRLTQSGVASNIDQAMSLGMGGPLKLGDLSMMGMQFPDMFVMVKEAAGPGTTIKINRPRFTDGATTESLRKLTPQSKLFGNSQGVTMDQVDVTIFEYGGPSDSTGNLVPISLSLFTQHRSKHDLIAYTANQMRRDRYKFVDDLAMTRLIAAASANSTGVTRGGDVAANANFTIQGNESMSFDLIPKAHEALKMRFVPGVGGAASYVMIADAHQVQQLRNDPAFQRLATFAPQYNPLFPGYVFSIGNMIVCESNRMQRLSNIGAASNLTGYQALIIAPGVYGWACAQDAFATRDKNDDGGRFAKFGWLAFEGWQVIDDRFVQLIITT